MRKVLFLWLVPLLLIAKSYYYPEIRTDVELLSDGNVRIRQVRTYRFEGVFSWAFVELKKKGAEDVKFRSLSERTGEGEEKEVPVELQDNAGSLRVQWNYSAQDEQKTFILDYEIVGATKRYRDVAEFYWKVIEDEHEKVERAIVQIILPGPSPELFKVYVHSRAKPGRLLIDAEKGAAVVEQTGIPQNVFVEVRVLASPALFLQTQMLPYARYAKILAEEKRNFLVSSLKRYMFVPLGFGVMVFVPLFLLLVYYRRYGREPRLEYGAVYEHEPPRLAPPVVVPRILAQKPDKDTLAARMLEGMFATLLQLANQGLVTVEEEGAGRKVSYRFRLKTFTGTDAPKNRNASLDAFSQGVLDFFFREVAKGDTLTEEAMKEYGKKYPAEVKKLLVRLGELATVWWEKELGNKLLDPESSRAYARYTGFTVLAIAAGTLLLAIGFGALVSGSGSVGIAVPILLGGLFFSIYTVAGRLVLRWHPVALLENQRWLRFRKFLVEFSALEQAPVKLLAIWEQYYVYATALGVAKEFLRNLVRLSTEQQAPLVVPAWYVAASGSGQSQMASFSRGLADFQGFASNFHSMMNSFSTSSSSGGGFSGGGGGGGGGGSSGAG